MFIKCRDAWNNRNFNWLQNKGLIDNKNLSKFSNYNLLINCV